MAAVADAKAGHDPLSQIEMVPVEALIPATINDRIYKPVRLDDPATVALADAIDRTNHIDPLNITLDDVIVSGHRRRAAAELSGRDVVPCIRLPIYSHDPEFPALLVSFNQQRDKDPAERIREQLVLTDPDEAYCALEAERAERAKVRAVPIRLDGFKRRKAISQAKRPFLDAVRRVIEEMREYWPLSDRRVHYSLLNDPPLIHASKPASRYRNDHPSYKALIDLLTRARLTGLVPFDAIGDDTRPFTIWNVFPSLTPFVREQVSGFLKGYARDLLVGQPSHVEIVGEKLTVENTIRPVAARYCVPYTIGRGYASLPPRKDMFDRFQASGKDQLVILFLSDMDPEGENIPETFGRSMRDDFGVDRVQTIKVGLTRDQAEALNLPRNTEAKTTSSRFKRFAARHGRHAYELEAVPPATLQQWLVNDLNRVIDVDLFNRQVEQEKRDAAELTATRKTAAEYLSRLSSKPGSGS